MSDNDLSPLERELLQKLNKEKAKLKIAESALEYYGNPMHYYPEYSYDQFVEADETVAREALQKIRSDK